MTKSELAAHLWWVPEDAELYVSGPVGSGIRVLDRTGREIGFVCLKPENRPELRKVAH